jgi:cytochrome P450
VPRGFRRQTKRSAKIIRRLITELTAARMEQIAAGTAPDDLATKIMTTADPQTGERFDTQEMVDQVAIFFLAGHETSASALAWALYLIATHPDVQARVAEEVAALPEQPELSDMSTLRLTRDVFREALRLYPPVPMMVRQAAHDETLRDRAVPKGSQIVLSPWHLHRNDRYWDRPDDFDPDRFAREDGKSAQRCAYIPFSAGPRVCTGAGFAMMEGPLILALILRAFRVEPVEGQEPVPVAHLTVRAENGIYLRLSRRETDG